MPVNSFVLNLLPSLVTALCVYVYERLDPHSFPSSAILYYVPLMINKPVFTDSLVTQSVPCYRKSVSEHGGSFHQHKRVLPLPLGLPSTLVSCSNDMCRPPSKLFSTTILLVSWLMALMFPSSVINCRQHSPRPSSSRKWPPMTHLSSPTGPSKNRRLRHPVS